MVVLSLVSFLAFRVLASLIGCWCCLRGGFVG